MVRLPWLCIVWDIIGVANIFHGEIVAGILCFILAEMVAMRLMRVRVTEETFKKLEGDDDDSKKNEESKRTYSRG